VYLAARIF
jgi:hypothetical protein